MKLISFIYERKIIRKILNHFGLFDETFARRERAPPVVKDQPTGTTIEPYDDGWPEYEEPFIDVQTL